MMLLHFSAIGSKNVYSDVKKEAYKFALTIGVNEGELITTGYGSLNETLMKAMEDTLAKSFVLLSSGFL